jgi:hypothetical protein
MSTAPHTTPRRFGLTVGAAFAVLGSISWWRGHQIPPLVLWTMAGLLIVPGLLLPSILAPVQRGWMRFAMVLGNFNTRLILTLLFYVVFTPVGMIMRLFRDPLNRSLRSEGGSNWIRRPQEATDPASYERQF